MSNPAAFTTYTPMIWLLGGWIADIPQTISYTAYDDSVGSPAGDGTETWGETLEIDGLGTATFITATGTLNDAMLVRFSPGVDNVGLLSYGEWIGSVSGSWDSATESVAYTYPVCFLAGSRVATPTGERAIETLAIGDLVTTASGVQKTVKWIGRMSIPLTRFNRTTATPVCIRAGALGNGLPQRDLRVSADHALFIDGVLVNAGVLVNGESIVRCVDHPGDVVEYFHVKLEDHDLLLAEGVATESLLLDDGTLPKFDNADEYRALYPDAVPGLPMPYGRVASVRQLPRALRATLAGLRAA